MQINILGTEYEIIKGSVLNCPSLKELDGFTDYTVKQIVVLDFGTVEKDDRSVKDFESLQKQVLRHEIIHAFLFESGLNVNSNDVAQWATNEEWWIGSLFNGRSSARHSKRPDVNSYDNCSNRKEQN